MTLSAFHGDPAIRAGLLARLRRHADAGDIRPGPLAWNGGTGSLVGCLLESDDAAQWRAACGLPAWLAVAVDGLSVFQGAPQEAAVLGGQVLEAIAPGADLEPKSSKLILWLLDDLLACPGADEVATVLRPVLDGVRGLHLQRLDGARAAPAEWKALRRRAMAATDALQGSPYHALAECVETAAWDPAGSPSCVLDTMRVWKNAASAISDDNAGWTDADDEDMKATLQRLYDTYMVPNPELKTTVFDLLEEHHPDKALRLRELNRERRAQAAAGNARATQALLGVLRSAPSPARSVHAD